MTAAHCPSCGQPVAVKGAAFCGYCLLRAGAVYEYRTVTVLGRGVHGIVYLAEQLPGERLVAVKILNARDESDEVLARLERCRDLLDSLNSPHAVHIFDLGLTNGGRPYVVSEYVRGIPIDRYLRSGKTGSAIMRGVVESARDLVGAAHAAGLVHGGLKPTNILVSGHDGTPTARVLDFCLTVADKSDDLAALARLTNPAEGLFRG